ncbi:MAG: 16S rRNA (adenine(1518)-N(6)/adenine(1519)-N(6))-dimethyltransferase RsmA [Dissulfurispiraceae bacterium]|jgi:16S rRNA (adenine1518-N6/adenine1519-N6)-dimethyltransferase|nr:16S rRNA (adenine(1518)-N(6)/adenine(1519)-N(6))-dimethyltransferase RsmA [Dissulfurispiraceae bacterium]
MAKKSLGQNFLFDNAILSRITAAASITKDDLVVEIGPGYGTLTKHLCKAAKRVLSIEIDEDLYNKLALELSCFENLELLNFDAMQYDFSQLGNFKVVANIPYYITTPILFRLIETAPGLQSMTLTVQKEVAERIVSQPGCKDYGVLSVAVQYYGSAEYLFTIPAAAFRPVPKVDSAVVYIDMTHKPDLDIRNRNTFFRVVKTAFSQRRKMLSNSLKPLFQDVQESLAEAGIEPTRRPETLSLSEFARISNILK